MLVERPPLAGLGAAVAPVPQYGFLSLLRTASAAAP